MTTAPDDSLLMEARGSGMMALVQARRPTVPEFGKPWLLDDVDLPEDVLRVPTMLSREEQKLLYVLARDH